MKIKLTKYLLYIIIKKEYVDSYEKIEITYQSRIHNKLYNLLYEVYIDIYKCFNYTRYHLKLWYNDNNISVEFYNKQKEFISINFNKFDYYIYISTNIGTSQTIRFNTYKKLLKYIEDGGID